MLFIAQFNQATDGPGALTKLLPDNLNWLVKIFGFIYVPLDQRPLVWLCCIFFCYFVWCYSTVTQPIVRGSKTLLSYSSERGRKITLIITFVQMSLMYCGLFAWYIHRFTFGYFSSVQVNDKPYLKITSMVGFENFLKAIPVLICLVVAFYIAKEFYKNEDFRKRFYSWEFSFLSNQSFSLRNNKCDVVVGWEKATNKPIVIPESSRFLHELVVGATGSGKTSTAILIRIVQDLVRIARGHKLGVVVLEPKSDLIRDVQKLAEELGIPKRMIKTVDPTDLVKSIKFNPLAGPLEVAAETWRGVLDALSGDQDPFFKGQQSETSAQYVMLGKIRYGNQFNFILHLQRMYTEPRYLADMTEEVRAWIDRNMQNPALTSEELTLLERYDRVCTYFENEVLEYVYTKEKDGGLPVFYPQGHKHAGKQVVINKKDKFIAGAKKYVTDISMNAMLSQLLVANKGDETLDLDSFLNDGGILLFNSALAELEELSLMFGQFIIRQMQSAIFRRPPEENGYKRIPIFFTIDEFPLYINEAFVRLLTLGRSYKVGTLIAIQNLGQLRTVQRGYDEVIVANASNKTVFGRGELKDNEYFSKHFGEEYVLEESMNESVTPMSMPNQSRGLRFNTSRKLQPRFTATQIKEQPFKHFIVEIVDRDGNIKEPIQAYGKFITETKFLKRFIDIGKIELATKNYKPLSFSGNIHQLSYLVRQLDNTPASSETVTEDGAGDISPATKTDVENSMESRQDETGQSNSAPSTAPNPAPSDSFDDELLQWPDEGDQQLAWPDPNNKETEAAANDEGEDPFGDVQPTGTEPPAIVESRDDDIPNTTYSIPDNVDELVKLVHDQILNPTDQQSKSSPTDELKAGREDSRNTMPAFDIDLLDDLQAADRQHTDNQKQYANEAITKVDEYKDDL
jgi:hypothetical protein